MNRMEETPAVTVERGKIKEKKGESPDFLYKVESYTREGVVSRWMEDIHRPVYRRLEKLYAAVSHEHNVSFQRKFDYDIDDEVYFFMFSDGRGQVIGKMSREE